MKLQQEGSGKTWQRLASKFWQDERGQSTTEYILILSVVVMVAMKFKKLFNDQLGTAMDKLKGDMDKAMED